MNAADRAYTLEDGRNPDYAGSTVRADFVPSDGYTSKAFLERENARLWPRVWQMACREEEIPNVGDYITYDIADETVVVLRSKDGVRAYHNVCPHRGRRLADGCGHTARLICKYHGWQWNLDGTNARVIDREDWGGLISEDDLTLQAVRAESWAGWIFINLDEDAEPLDSFLGEAKTRLDPLQIDKMRYYWHKSIHLPCNWKAALEAFSEGYHVQTTHRQLLKYSDDYSVSRAAGRHSLFWYPPTSRMRGAGSPRLGDPRPDYVQGMVEYFDELEATLDAQITTRETELVRQLPARVAADASAAEIGQELMKIFREAAESSGWDWPPITPQEMFDAGTDWHIFPNMVLLPRPSAVLGYRARPDRDDPNKCLFEVYSVQRFAPGGEPKLEKKHNDDGADVDFWGLILTQDFQNMGEVQRGMRSSAFKASRPNPVQEVAVANFHRALYDFIGPIEP